jgi:hypothetical protein|tara:strand:- start:105 stop:677 length:573 start_codon:yes stop_codon:yes gene_type:complete
MLSLIEKTDSSRAVYFDSLSKITQITNQIQDTKDLFAWFDFETIKPFLEGTLKFSDHIITRTGNPLIYEIIKTKVDLNRRNKDNQLHKITTIPDSDILLYIEDGDLVFEASESLKKSIGIDAQQVVTVAGRTEHVFFVTYKDKPEFLIKTILIPFSELLSTGKRVKFEENKYSISVYTQKYFDKYSWRKV